MELVFNELSIFPLSENNFKANDKMKQFAITVAEARKRGYRNIRSYHTVHEIHLANEYTIFQWLNNKDVSEVERNFLYGMIIQPFIHDEDELIEERYIYSNYYFEDLENGFEKQECVGLATAYLYETLSISISSSNAWIKSILPILIEKDDLVTSENVLNVSSQVSFEVTEIKNLIENSGEVNLVETNIEPNDKKIHLADHHGKAELLALCNKLKLNPFVIEMRSTNWGGNKFIRDTFSDGVVEIVLINSQRKYALWVQTTARNIRETKAIAKVLEEKYS